MKLHFIMLAGASALAISWVAVPASAADAATASAPDGKSSVGEVVVTARRQTEKLQDVPQTVAPITAKTLQNLQVHDLEDIQGIVPGLTLTTGVFAEVQLRGVGFNNFTNGDSTIGFYLNDADVPAGYTSGALYDIGQVEVLSGPQGTNRGVSSPSGAITVTTHRPDLSRYGGYIDGVYSDQHDRQADTAVNLPIIKDMLALRLAGYYQETDDDDVGSINSTEPPSSLVRSMRVSLRFKPTDSFEANLMYQNTHDQTDTFPQVFGPGGGAANNPPLAADQRTGVTHVPNTVSANLQVVTANVDYRILGQKISYVGEYSYGKNNTRSPQDISNELDGAETYTTVEKLGSTETSHELRISSEPGTFHWIDYTAGVYYRNLSQFGQSHFAGAFLPGAFGSNLTSPIPSAANFDPRYFLSVLVEIPFQYTELSAFGNLTIHLGENTEITGGLRKVSSDFKANNIGTTQPAFEAVNVFGTPCSSPIIASHGLVGSDYPGYCDFPIPAGPAFNGTDHAKDSPLLYSVEMSHHFSRDLMVYANTGTSFQRPTATIGLNGPFSGSSDPALRQLAFHPGQTSTGYEVGLKWTLPSGLGLFDLAIYKQDFGNFQILTNTVNYLDTTQATPSRSQFAFPTSVSASITGFDVTATFNVTRRWNLTFMSSYADGSTKGNAPCNLFNASNQPIYNTDGVISFCSNSAEVSPNPIWNATLQSNYTQPLTDNIEGFVRGLVSYYPANSRVSHLYTVPSYVIANFYAGVSSRDGAWQASLFLKNAFDNQTVLGHSEQPIFMSGLSSFTLPPPPNYVAANMTPPREFGINLTYAFGSR